MMSTASGFEPFDRGNVFYDRETWDAMFQESLKGDPAAADSLAWLLFRIVRELDERKKGRRRVVNTMKLGLEWVYPYTQAHKLSFQGFLYYVEGLLLPGDFPEELMKGVIERGEQQAREVYGEEGNGEESS